MFYFHNMCPLRWTRLEFKTILESEKKEKKFSEEIMDSISNKLKRGGIIWAVTSAQFQNQHLRGYEGRICADEVENINDEWHTGSEATLAAFRIKFLSEVSQYWSGKNWLQSKSVPKESTLFHQENAKPRAWPHCRRLNCDKLTNRQSGPATSSKITNMTKETQNYWAAKINSANAIVLKKNWHNFLRYYYNICDRLWSVYHVD